MSSTIITLCLLGIFFCFVWGEYLNRQIIKDLLKAIGEMQLELDRLRTPQTEADTIEPTEADL